MKQGNLKLSIIAATTLLISVNAVAAGQMEYVEKKEEPVKVKSAPVPKPKRTLNGNMTLNYNVVPGNVETIEELFSKGIFYGRVRMNAFYWEWSVDGAPNKAPKQMGAGGSLIYKSGIYKNFSFMIGYYGSLNPSFWRPSAADAQFSKAGKDTFSRYKVKTGGGFGLYALGEAYLEYGTDRYNIKAGRQLFESVFTKSNDTKMIPNTFDGVSAGVKIAPKSTVRVAWFGYQKLRDHETHHDVITFGGDDPGNKWNKWRGNDDAGAHKGLTYEKFVAAGKDPHHNLYLADFSSKYIKNLKFTASYLQVPGVVQDGVVEAHYKIPVFDSGWAVRPGVRYFLQGDDGGGAIAGYTNLFGKNALGYDASVAHSLDSNLLNLRVDTLMPNKKGFFRIGYSNVADKADIVAPWRGFPTGGFTRAMAQYNWFANTETWMVRAVYKFNSTWKASLRYAIQNFDDRKDYVPSDSKVIHLDIWTNITKNLQMRMRYGNVSAKSDTVQVHLSTPSDTKYKKDWSYNEFRWEFNYLF